jgi:DNA-binding NarL/FixJ family response regulator
MRVIIVEGMLDEVLAVLEKTRQSNDITGVSPVADTADEHHGKGAGKDEPDKKGCSPLPLLSCRERSIVAHLMEGHSNKVIARDLGVAEPTVKSHIKIFLTRSERRTERKLPCGAEQISGNRGSCRHRAALL